MVKIINFCILYILTCTHISHNLSLQPKSTKVYLLLERRKREKTEVSANSPSKNSAKLRQENKYLSLNLSNKELKCNTEKRDQILNAQIMHVKQSQMGPLHQNVGLTVPIIVMVKGDTL